MAHGGGQLVGWLPIVRTNKVFIYYNYLNILQVSEDESAQNNKDFVNFKRVVWHKSFIKLLASIKNYSHIGCWITCGDGVLRWLFPCIFILSADYEEQ